jgi:hypothetical protein
MSGGAAFDRFAHWPRGAARAALVVIVLLLAAAAWTAPNPPRVPVVKATAVAAATGAAAKPSRDRDLQLYEQIAARVRAGENYYTAAISEQRAGNYPVRPGIAVRLPTLAFLTAWLGTGGLFVLGAVLGLAGIAAWWRRLGEEPGGRDRRLIAVLLLLVGGIMGLKPQYILVHEVWAGLLLALAVALYRPGQWWAAWIAVALALSIRELALPFALLLAGFAAGRRDWRELVAWVLLIALFAAGLAWHLHEVSRYLLPSDRPSPPWLVLRGLGGWTGNVIESSVLQNLPYRLAAPLVLLPLLGWAGWKTRLGLFCALLFAGYGAIFMIAGRVNNFYWALMVTPAWFAGYAFLPMALNSLLASARAPRS